jgi:hypothetical protein
MPYAFASLGSICYTEWIPIGKEGLITRQARPTIARGKEKKKDERNKKIIPLSPVSSFPHPKGHKTLFMWRGLRDMKKYITALLLERVKSGK